MDKTNDNEEMKKETSPAENDGTTTVDIENNPNPNTIKDTRPAPEIELGASIATQNQTKTIDIESTEQGIKDEEEKSVSCCKQIYKSKPMMIFILLFQTVLCITPIWDITTDILTTYLYFDSGDTNWTIISLVILLYSLRNQFIFWSMVMTETLDDENVCNPMLYACTGAPMVDMLLLIPYIGPSIICTTQCSKWRPHADHIEYNRLPMQCALSLLCYGIVTECCLISIGVCLGPIIVIVVVLQKFYINMVGIIDICKGEIITMEKAEQHKKNKSMFVLLKFIEATTEALPQLVLQTYVFITTETYADRQAFILFWFSIATCIISLIKCLYQIVVKWKDVVEAMEVDIYDNS